MALPRGDPVPRRSAAASCGRRMWSTGPDGGCTQGARAPPAGRRPGQLKRGARRKPSTQRSCPRG